MKPFIKQFISYTGAWLLLVVQPVGTLSAQGTADDYRRAYALRKEFSNKVYYGDVRPQWIGNTHKCWYTNHTPEGIDHVIPGNDDSGKAIRLYARGAADAILEGRAASLQEVVKVAGDDEEFVEVDGEEA